MSRQRTCIIRHAASLRERGMPGSQFTSLRKRGRGMPGSQFGRILSASIGFPGQAYTGVVRQKTCASRQCAMSSLIIFEKDFTLLGFDQYAIWHWEMVSCCLSNCRPIQTAQETASETGPGQLSFAGDGTSSPGISSNPADATGGYEAGCPQATFLKGVQRQQHFSMMQL